MSYQEDAEAREHHRQLVSDEDDKRQGAPSIDMTRPATEYEWTVVLRNDKQGFAKTFEVEAPNIDEALDRAFDELVGRGYAPDPFVSIEAKRGREVGT